MEPRGGSYYIETLHESRRLNFLQHKIFICPAVIKLLKKLNFIIYQRQNLDIEIFIKSRSEIQTEKISKLTDLRNKKFAFS